MIFKKKITFQLFFSSLILCGIIIACIIISEFVLAKFFYINNEKQNIEVTMEDYMKDYQSSSSNDDSLHKKENDIYTNKGIMIARLDATGEIVSLPSGNFFIEGMMTDTLKKFRISLNNLINYQNIISYDFGMIINNLITNPNTDILVNSLDSESDYNIIPISILIPGSHTSFAMPNYNLLSDNEPIPLRRVPVVGTVINMNLPIETQQNYTMYDNLSLAEDIIAFQVDVLTAKRTLKPDMWNQTEKIINGIKYMELVKPVTENGEISGYIFTLTSLQPVMRFIKIMQKYYPYILLFSLLLTSLFCFFYSHILTKPILAISEATKEILNFNFNYKISVESKNEIGELADNINLVSKRIEEYIRELEEMNNKLKSDISKEERLKNTRKEFISGVSHELKTPLSILQMGVTMIQETDSPSKSEEYWRAIENEIEYMDKLINEMLKLAKYESGTFQMEVNKISLKHVVEQAIYKLSPMITEKNIKLYLDLKEFDIMGNESLLIQATINLLTNAIHHTDAGKKIAINVSENSEIAYLSIENEGTHLSEENIEKVWHQFYRTDSSRKRTQGGTGLGLSIVGKIMDLHYAEYGIKNTAAGVLFHFSIPKQYVSEKDNN
ncbi:sensor histidine kinase [Clostridium sp. UBA6640]|uniref:sensor histidine kinase n=1 Tax=Clostridium sp. UBA6640 TaxID=1946370 RepID=UPI0025C55105|nr:HAMP domain-containing sensor histidine kinase [Clostridium sp. UBA6640]